VLIAFIIFWVLVAGIVVFTAMHRGPRGARQALYTEHKIGERLVLTVVAAMFVFGVVVPAFVLIDNGEHKASAAVGGVHLTPEEVKGRELFAKSCVGCHTLAAVKSVGHIGPNLDIRVGDDVATPAGRRALVLSAVLEGRARGLGQMPAELYVGKEAEDVAAFVAAVAGH
jgi:heme/copper-type cytochrome/quinol oxidase subunit 2